MRIHELRAITFYPVARGTLVLGSLTLVLGSCQERAPSSEVVVAASPAQKAHEPGDGPRGAQQPAAEVPRHKEHDHSAHMLSAAAPLADRSLYHLQASFTDQDGRGLELASLRGSAVLAAMFYASCQSVCPMLIAQLARIDAMLPSDTRAHTQVLLVSLDPARDSTEKLKQLAQRHGITDPRWHIVRTQPESVRELAALLGVRYRQLPDGEISHSPVIGLLDREGVVAQRMENAADDPTQLTAAVTKLTQAM